MGFNDSSRRYYLHRLLKIIIFPGILSCFPGIFAQDINRQVYYLPYDKVVFITTHNAYNHRPDHLFPNQRYNITRQLNDGVRGFMLDIYLHKNQVEMYHGFRLLGHTKLIKTLIILKKFLDTHPDAIITLFFECYVPFKEVEKVFIQSKLMTYLNTQPKGKKWLTLNEMIASGKRLVVFSSENDSIKDSWYHYVYDYATETAYSNSKPSDFNFQSGRGSPENSLLILNNFLYSFTGTGSPCKAKHVNSFHFLFDRCMRCINETGKTPNFLAVDFYNKGKVFKVADSINKISLEQFYEVK
jgi:hypothetical protein